MKDEILQDLARRLGSGPRSEHPHSTSRPTGCRDTARKSTLVDNTSASNTLPHPRGRDRKRLRLVKKHKPGADRVSGKTAITKAKLATQSSSEMNEYRQTAPHAEGEESRAAYEQADQRGRQEEWQYGSPGTRSAGLRAVYPSTLNCTAAQLGMMSLTPMTRAKPQATLPLIPGRQGTSVSIVSSSRRQSNSGTQQVGQVHRLLAVQPTSFSQTRPAVDLMVRAYGERRKGTRVASDQFIWSEVFPVLRPVESRAGKIRRGRGGRALSYPTSDVTVLPKLATCSGGENQRSVLVKAATAGDTTCAVPMCGLKLPRID